MSRIRILLADDHPVVRAGLVGLLSSQPDFEVVGEAADGQEALRAVERLLPQVVLMDLRMPGMDGVSAIRQIRSRFPQVQILVLTTYDTDSDIVRAVEAGATGYLLKDVPREELFRAVRLCARGEAVLSPPVAARLLGRMRGPAEENLSLRELEVLALVARGLSNKEIARKLKISEATVKTHLLHTFSKLGVDDRTAAVTVALQRGLIRL
ncbi:MAG: response regulator transcription factor [Meiothermus sp.]|uniref:response regulator n=1 Tax=Meiothermus sp. TaxID=1955249 RepID=UPI0025FD9E5A|nr:response regulator transcription factor [Meiothermus sp.]MCS7058408.1 response regulator transcription factor [Meiothermus sp.]MCS7195456.1 response regulator transcription factor [Meiothermus sp.]MCX7740914.1 response regulator transcription factor [Meiothermus sp.]MDW8089804.1 response regulator transcription factor [Meiothermus sp.]MDW8481771.1 response regulator transcription factor [Meiothermus sp.]